MLYDPTHLSGNWRSTRDDHVALDLSKLSSWLRWPMLRPVTYVDFQCTWSVVLHFLLCPYVTWKESVFSCKVARKVQESLREWERRNLTSRKEWVLSVISSRTTSCFISRATLALVSACLIQCWLAIYVVHHCGYLMIYFSLSFSIVAIVSLSITQLC